jgi:hypothetical protein
MARAATSRLKVNPALGSPPTLEWRAVGELHIDASYQREINAGPSQTLIRRIAMFWDWGLCQPLAVSRRPNGSFTIVDGQHRASAAKLRGDIAHLPCVITSYASAGDEAAAFVALNQQRRPLSGLDVFKAALAAGDMEATQVNIALTDAGLRIASSTNLVSLPAGAMSNVRGLQRCYRIHGVQVLTAALRVLSQAYPGEVLKYGGTIFPGVEEIVAAEMSKSGGSSEEKRFPLMVSMVGGTTQQRWYKLVSARTGDVPTRRAAAAAVFADAWRAFADAAQAPAQKLVRPPEKPPRTFEQQLEAVRNGAKLVEKIDIKAPPPDRTLGGAPPEFI